MRKQNNKYYFLSRFLNKLFVLQESPFRGRSRGQSSQGTDLHVRIFGWCVDGSLERDRSRGCDDGSRDGPQLRNGARLRRLLVSRRQVLNAVSLRQSIITFTSAV